MMKMRKYMQGITLMELMIVVVIIGVLTAIAFPNYRSYVARAKRSEAKAALLKCAVNQEKNYLQNGAFTTTLSELGFGSAYTDSGSYSIAATSTNVAQTFICTATYTVSDDEASKCNTFSIDANGNKTSGPLTDCWTRRN